MENNNPELVDLVTHWLVFMTWEKDGYSLSLFLIDSVQQFESGAAHRHSLWYKAEREEPQMEGLVKSKIGREQK